MYRVLLLFFFTLTIYLVFFSSLFRVKNIIVDTGDEALNNQIKEEIKPLLKGKYLGFLFKDQLLFVSQGKIKKTVLAKFKNLEDVNVSKKIFDQLEIKIKRKAGSVAICNERCFALDGSGVVLNEINRSDIPKFGDILEVIRDESNSSINPGDGINTKEFINLVLSVKKEVKDNIGLEIKDIFVPLPSASEIKAKTDEGMLLFFSSEDTLDNQLGALKIVLEKEISAENRICVEYIDLRILNKAYYKLFDDCDNLKKAQAEEKKRKEKEEQAWKKAEELRLKEKEKARKAEEAKQAQEQKKAQEEAAKNNAQENVAPVPGVEGEGSAW